MHSKEIGEIIMHLPKEVNNTKGVLTKNGTVVYKNKNNNSVVSVQALKEYQDGMCFDSVRSLITIKNNLASHKYSFNFELPKGYRLVKDYDYNYNPVEYDCGAVYILNAEDDVVSTINPAWAKDAKGKQINTDYDVIGSTLIQNVEFNKDTAFPIIADPTQHPTYDAYVGKLSKSEAISVKRKYRQYADRYNYIAVLA